jgi:glycosyltransferase involved in cell wall biosynthesis
MPDTVVFIPAWNEELNLPSVLEELDAELPDVDVVVIDDGSTDGTADAARSGGADVVSFGENRGLPAGIAAGYAYAHEKGYLFCGRVDADGQHPADELRRLLDLVRSGRCDVAVGSRFASGDGYEARRYEASNTRAFGHWILRRLIQRRLERPMLDATSGMYAVNERALPYLSQPYEAGAPEVEGLIRLADAGLTVEEVPVHMRERAGGESKLRGKKAVMLVLTVAGVVLVEERWRRGRWWPGR